MSGDSGTKRSKGDGGVLRGGVSSEEGAVQGARGHAGEQQTFGSKPAPAATHDSAES